MTTTATKTRTTHDKAPARGSAADAGGFGAFNGGGLKAYGAAPVRDELARANADGKAPRAIGEIRKRSTPRTVHARRMARLAREQNAIDVIGKLPDPGEDVVIVMDGQYHGWDILGAIITLAGQGVTVDEAYITTLGFNNTQADHLAELIDDGTINNLAFIVSEMFTQKNASEYDHLAKILTDRGQAIHNTRNHAKLMLLKFSDRRHIVAHGSLNLRRCNSFEQIVISNDKKLYRFFAEFIADVIAGDFQP